MRWTTNQIVIPAPPGLTIWASFKDDIVGPVPVLAIMVAVDSAASDEEGQPTTKTLQNGRTLRQIDYDGLPDMVRDKLVDEEMVDYTPVYFLCQHSGWESSPWLMLGATAYYSEESALGRQAELRQLDELAAAIKKEQR